MRRISLAVVVAALSVGAIQSVSAQDILRSMYSSKPVSQWTGFYVGGNFGYGWAKDSAEAIATPGTIASSSFTMKGPLAGGQIGAMVQFSGPWVIGIESDFQWSGQKFNGAGNLSLLNQSVGFPPPSLETVKMDWFGTTRGRFGYAVDSVMFYGTVGMAYAAIRTEGSISGFTQIKQSPVKLGWAIGGGVEFMLSRNWSIRGEYLHLDFGGSSDTYVAGPFSVDLHQRITDEIVRVGVNYMFR